MTVQPTLKAQARNFNFFYGDVYELNPDDSAAWETADVNALLAGPKVAS